MKIPICELCAKTGVLCSGCENKLKAGKISELDVEVSKILTKLSDKFNLQNADVTKVVDLGRVVLILTKGDVGLLIGKDGKVVAELSNKLGKKVRIAEVSGDMRKTISDMVVPVKLVGINVLYKKDGEKVYKVRLLKSEIRQLPVDINTLEKALNSVMESTVAITFE
ncbi:MAG: transcription elongation factor NusA [Candidatus Micrarchaeia archaeon]